MGPTAKGRCRYDGKEKKAIGRCVGGGVNVRSRTRAGEPARAVGGLLAGVTQPLRAGLTYVAPTALVVATAISNLKLEISNGADGERQIQIRWKRRRPSDVSVAESTSGPEHARVSPSKLRVKLRER